MQAIALRLFLLAVAAITPLCSAASDPVSPPPSIAAVLTGANTGAAGAKICFPEPDYNFGKATAGEIIHHTFVVSNAGAETLVITDVRGTCGCTTAGEWTREIAPGNTGVVPIQINTANMQGTIHKEVIVTSNDKLQPTATLNLTGQIWMPIELRPMTAYLRVTSVSQTNVSTVVHIFNKTDKPLTLSPPEVNNRLFTAEIKAVQPGKEFELRVWTKGLPPSGRTPGLISMKTSVPELPVLTINAVAIGRKKD